MTMVKRYALLFGVGLAVGFYIGARVTTTVLSASIAALKKGSSVNDELERIRQNLDEYKAGVAETSTDEWYRNDPIVQRLEREEEERNVRASTGSDDASRALERIRRGVRPDEHDGDTTLDELHRRSR